MYGDPTTTPGGKAIPFHSSIRIKLGAGQPIKNGDDVIGINVSAKTIKNNGILAVLFKLGLLGNIALSPLTPFFAKNLLVNLFLQ